MRLLLTRPQSDNGRIADLLPSGVTCLFWPLTQVLPVAEATLATGTEGLIFTSANAVKSFAQAQPVRDLPVFCVGPRTAGSARAAGFRDVRESAGGVPGLVTVIAGTGLTSLDYPRAKDVAHDLPALMAKSGIAVTEQVIYSTAPAGPPDVKVRDALTTCNIDMISIWSPRAARLFENAVRQMQGWRPESADLLAISSNAAAPLLQAGFRRIYVAETPDSSGMVDQISAALRQNGG